MKKKSFFNSNKGVFLYDIAPFDMGFSLYKIRKDYNGFCVRVRRSSDFYTSYLDIGFLNGKINEVALLNYVGAGTGVVEIWYNQIGTNNAVQNSSANMPQIVIGGVVTKIDTKPTIFFPNTSVMVFNSELVSINYSLFTYGKRNAGVFLPMGGFASVLLAHWSDFRYYFQTIDGYTQSNNVDMSTDKMLLEGHSAISTKKIYRNNNLIASTFFGHGITPNFATINNYSGNLGNSYYSEIILYKSNQESLRTEIANDINLRNS